MNETLQIETPENVSFGYTLAGIGSRFMAAIVDTLAIIVLQMIVDAMIILIVLNVGNGELTSTWLVAIYSLLGFVFFWGYYIFFEMLWNGQSPGKRWVGIRVVRTDGMPITLAESLVRNLVRTIDLLPVAYGVLLIT